MLGLMWLAGLVRRRPTRLIGATAGVALAVALLASIGSFLAASKQTMTQRAAARVAVDWQVQATPNADRAAVGRMVADHHGVDASVPVDFGDTGGLAATVGGTTQTTGPGVVVGLPAGYANLFPGELRPLVGSTTGALLAQQTAANLHAAPGDTVTVTPAGQPPVQVRIAGVVDLPAADSLFQRVGAPPGSQAQAPPDNVLLVPASTFDQLYQADTSGTHVRHQWHVKLSHRLPSDPAAAFAQVTGSARNLETTTTGAAIVGNNLGATLDGARGDALYAQVLFLFLGLPGAVLAGLLTGWVANAGAERRRRDLALLRIRGATTRRAVGLAASEAVAVAVVGGAVGLGAASLIGQLAFGSARFGATSSATLGWSIGAVLAGLVIAAASMLVPTWRAARSQAVAASRRVMTRRARPWWSRLGVDVLLLALAGWVFWLTGRNGYKLVLVPEGVPTISVSYWALAGPALLWAGAALVAWRLADTVLLRGRRIIARAARPVAGQLAGTVAATMSRQRRLLANALVLVALAGTFAASTAIFNATYRAQAEVDARLTNGADLTVALPAGGGSPTDATPTLGQVAGVRHIEPLQHRFAYVGADLQDLFGVRPSTIVSAGKLQNAYFTGGSARTLIGRLAAQPDGILVSAETAKDFQLSPGDHLTLRLQDAHTHQLVPVAFRYVGVAKEFPTAPKDSFLVANADYVARASGSSSVESYLIDTGSASPTTVAGTIHRQLGPAATVSDITTTRKVVGSSLTAVDLAGLTRVELGFAAALAAAATGLVLALGFAERRRTFALAAALGAKPRQLAAFVWSEAAFVAVGGLVAGALIGGVLSYMLVKVLTGVFDPPPAALSLPWAYLGLVAGLAAAGAIIATLVTIAITRRPAITTLRDL